MLSEIEQAFAENLVLMGALNGPQLAGLLHRRDQDPRPLWDQARELRIAPDGLLADAKGTAEAALAACGPQAFSFSDGAMVGPWELIQPRGSGPGGGVWHARLATNSQQVASVRLVPPGTGDDPGRRLRWIEHSNPGLEPPHPSILKVDEADEDFGWLYAASIGFDGRTLQELRSQGPLLEPSAIAMAQSLAGSLSVVHDLGVVHGGLNPFGVLVAGQRTYLSDFGVSSTLLDGPIQGCRPGGRLHPLLFAAPELVRGDATRGLDARDDLYALGALLYWATCQTAPGEPRSGPNAPWLFDPPVSAGLKGVLARLLSPRPEGCYPTARAVLTDLARLAQGQAPGGLPPLAGPPVRGRRAPMATAQQIVRAPVAGAAPPAGPRPIRPSVMIKAPADEAMLEERADEDEAPPVDEEVAGEEPEAEAPLRASASGRQRPVSGRLRKGKPKPPAPRPKARWGESAGARAKADQGWLIFAGSLVVVLGGLFMAKLVSDPAGKELGRVRLAQAERLMRVEAPRYADAVTAIDEAVVALGNDPALIGPALERRDDIVARAAAERLALLPAGLDAAPDAVKEVEPKLRDLQQRAHGLAAGTLCALDLARATGNADMRTWIDLGLDLLNQGEPAAAVLATQKSGRSADRQHAEQLSGMAFLPGGPYLVPRASGEGLELVQRPALYVGRQEVTRAEYRRFLAGIRAQEKPHATCDPSEPAGEDHRTDAWSPDGGADGALPATSLDYWDATAYARWRGGELPDVATLAAAARGRAARRFPWGSLPPSLAFANVADFLGALAPSGCWPGGAGVGGALDLVGNAEEWTWITGAARESPIFGGHFATPAAEALPAAPRAAPLEERKPERGFRYVRKATVQVQ